MRIVILVVPYEAGQRSVGVGLGPARLLEAGLAHELRDAGHDVREALVELPDNPPAQEMARIVELQRALAWQVAHASALGEFPIVLAGNCSSAVGALAGRPQDSAVVWFDAHGDFNTPDTTLSGMIDGMALAMATGRCCRELTADVHGFQPIDERRVLLVGARDLDPEEERLLESSAIHCVSVSEANTLADRVQAMGPPAPSLYVHLDLDVIDPEAARANRFAAPAGFSANGIIATMESLTRSSRIYALAVTAYDPAYDTDGNARRVAIRAIHAAVAPDYDRE